MKSLAGFLPPHLLNRRSKVALGVEPPVGGRLESALLLADVSGFTSLTEKLQSRGREGAEEIAMVINRAFRPAIRTIEGWGGSIVSFGGDSVFAVFPGASPARRAVRAAEEIRARFARRRSIVTSAGSVELGIKLVVHFGAVRETVLSSSGRHHYLVTGNPIRSLARMEKRAARGGVNVSSEARARLRVERPPRPGGARRRGGRIDAPLRALLAPWLAKVLRGFEGQFRTLSILFLETTGGALRPMQSFVARLHQILELYGGVLLETDISPLGTRWLCVFGLPEAHEDDADRAARAGIALCESESIGLRLRGGLSTGVTVNILIGTASRHNFGIMGDAVNTAARALGEAAWGEILLTEDALGRLRSATTRDRGLHVVKGKAAPLRLHALAHARRETRRIEVSAPLVGREDELRALTAALGRARHGRGGIVGVRGDAGLGKSRLKWELQKLARARGFRVLEGRALPFGAGPYQAIGDLLRQAVGVPQDVAVDITLARVARHARRLGLGEVEGRHLAEVLGARAPRSPLDHLGGDAIRLNNMLAIQSHLAALSDREPSLFVLEDLHWADEMTRGTVRFLAERESLARSRAMLLLLYRPGYEPPGEIPEQVLSEIPGSSVNAMLRALLGKLPAGVVQVLREKAGGNPFYVEEMVRHLIEFGFRPERWRGADRILQLGSRGLPNTIESLIEARLDRLSWQARRLIQLAAVIGRSFPRELLFRIDESRGLVKRGLGELLAHELLFENVSGEDPTGGGRGGRLRELIFKHAMTRDVAYGTILGARRRVLHRAVARALEKLFPHRFHALLGHHWELAGDGSRARVAYLAGARLAASSYSHEMAERLYRAYLALVQKPTAESIEARRQLAERVLWVQGRGAAALAEHQRAFSDAGAIGDRRLQAMCLLNVGFSHQRSGRLREARAHYDETRTFLRASPDRRVEANLLGNLATLAGEQGQIEEAIGSCRRALRLYRKLGDHDSEGRLLVNLAAFQQERGLVDEARATYTRAARLARRSGDPRIEGIVLCNLANLHMGLGRLAEAEPAYEQSLALARKLGERRLEGVVLGNLAKIHRHHDRFGEARATYERAATMARDVGNRRLESYVLLSLADMYVQLKRWDEARAAGRRGLEIACDVGDLRLEGAALSVLAQAERLAGFPREADALAARAEGRLEESGAGPELVMCLLERVRIARARGERGEKLLERATRLAGQLKGTGSSFDAELAELRAIGPRGSPRRS